LEELEENLGSGKKEEVFVLYTNGKPSTKYTNMNDAKKDVDMLRKKNPNLRVEIKKEFRDNKNKRVEEDLGPEQKRVGQLGPTEKVKNNNIGKLVGANESADHDELSRILDIARFRP